MGHFMYRKRQFFLPRYSLALPEKSKNFGYLIHAVPHPEVSESRSKPGSIDEREKSHTTP